MYNPAMNESSSEFASSKAPSGRTQWHRILGALLELLLTRLGIIVQSEVQVMSDPPKVDIVLLRREERWANSCICSAMGYATLLPDTCWFEFKYSESLSVDALLQALGYHYFYRQSQSLSEAELQTFVMVAITPRRQLLEHFGFSVSEVPGVYRRQQPPVGKGATDRFESIAAESAQRLCTMLCQPASRLSECLRPNPEIGWEAQLSQSAWALVAGLQRQREQKGRNHESTSRRVDRRTPD